MTGPVVCQVNSQASTKTLETSDDEVRDVGLELQAWQGWLDWELDVVLVAVGDDDLADMLPAPDICESGRDSIEAICDHRVDGFYMAHFNQVEDLVKEAIFASC